VSVVDATYEPHTLTDVVSSLLFSLFFLKGRYRSRYLFFLRGRIGDEEAHTYTLLPSVLLPRNNNSALLFFLFFPISSSIHDDDDA
jgi:hypothetical protein